MLKAHTSPPREEWTLKYLCGMALKALGQTFSDCLPELPPDLFKQMIYEPLIKMKTGGDELVSLIKIESKNNFHILNLIQVSCAYCIQAQKADALGDEKLARSYLMDAYLYLGMAAAGAASSPQVERLRADVAKLARSTHARQTSAANAAPWNKAKGEAMRLIRERASVGERWVTYSQAARAIAPAVGEFLMQHSDKRFQSMERRIETIAKWLREMPEADELFESQFPGSGKI